MSDRWSFSTTGYTFVGKSHDYIREVCRATGFSGIQGVDMLFADCSESDLVSIRDDYADAGLSIDSFHLPFESHLDIASFYETTRRAAVETMMRHMECAAALGARVVIQHPSTSRFDVTVEGFDNSNLPSPISAPAHL
jgi:sugar phosphate isomerase/epimerase